MMLSDYPDALANAALCEIKCDIEDGGQVGPAQAAWCVNYLWYCIQSEAAADLASTAAKTLEAGLLKDDPGRVNAFHHAYWMALMVGVYGVPEDAALSLGTAHEMDVQVTGHEWGTNNSVIDMHNNMVGARIGVNFRRREVTGGKEHMRLLVLSLILEDTGSLFNLGGG